MWNELNRILGVNRKDGLSEPEGVRDAAAPEPGHEPDTAGGAAAAQSQSERERHEPARMALPKNSAPATDDGLGVSPVDDAEWARIIAEESSFDADPVESAAFEWDPAEVRPMRGPGSVTSSTGTTSDARTKASTIWRRPTGSSPRKRPEVLRTLRTQSGGQRSAELARNGVPRPPFYMSPARWEARTSACMPEGEERVFLTQEGQQLPRSRSGSAGRRPRPTMPCLHPLCPGRVAVRERESGTRAAATNRRPAHHR